MSAAAGGAMQVEGTRGRPDRAAEKGAARPVSLANKVFDLPGPIPLQRSYIVASTPRCGGTFLCTRLWATGVLGAPAEYFGYQKQLATKMMARLKASSPADYLGKLLACRTSKNGVFGMNMEFNDFDEALRRFPGMLAVLSPITYIYVDRKDQLSQAAFMAKSVQTDAGPSKPRREPAVLRYDRDLISKWLGRIERQKLGWMRWFEGNGIVPFKVTYEDFITKPGAVVRSIVELLGVENNEPQKLRVALAERPTDRTSTQWAARFERETTSGIEYEETAAAIAAKSAADHVKTERKAPHVFDRYDEIKGTPAAPVAAKRMRHRYDAIIACNRDLFKNARVLDIRSGDGRWCLAALDAGAAHVVGIEGQQRTVDAASNAFGKLGVKPESYQFVNNTIFEALNSFSPAAFDLILCRELSSDPHFFFKCLWRLRPKNIVLDTKIIGRKEPVAVFKVKQQEKAGATARRRISSLNAIPNHALITVLCGYFGFRCRVIDWRALGIIDWTGVHDYERDRRHTYVLDQIAR